MFKRNPEIQYKTAAEIKRFQERRMREALQYLKNKSNYYKKVFSTYKINVDKIRTIEDLQHIPVTTKTDLQLYNNDFVCVDKRNIIDYVTTSGTMGNPVTFALTNSDLDRLGYNEYLSFTTAGLTRDDIMQEMVTIDRRFMAGLAYFLGCREVGMGVSRVGNGIPELQWDTINRILPTCCICVPSFLIKLIDFAEKNNIDYHQSSLRKCVCIGEALRTPAGEYTTLGESIIKKWPELVLHTTYASTEMQASFTDCSAFNGGHLQPELIIVEFLDENNNPVPEGEAGEVTITSLGVEGMPLLRFKTGDVCYHYNEPCKCGRNTTRLSSIIGRKGQMIKYKGTTLYPPALFDILDGIKDVTNYVVEVYTNELGTDEIRVKIGTNTPSDAFSKNIKDVFRSKVRVAPTIQFATPDAIARLQLPEMSRKPIKFFDLRQNTL